MTKDEATPAGDDYAARRQMYDAYIKDARAQQVASLQSYDKAILLYSSGGLALSLTFLKDFVKEVGSSVDLGFLHLSWVLFALAMLATILSFLVSAAVHFEGMQDAEEYYLEGKDSARDRKSCSDVVLSWLNRASGFFFLGAVGATVWFAIANV